MIPVSTIIPAYNSARTIRESVDSALAQEFDGQEIIVVDDGSTDSTSAILESYGGRIKVVTQPNSGTAAARNAGVRASSGQSIAFLDSDDFWLPGRLTKTADALERNPRAVMAFSDLIARNREGHETVVRTGPAPSLDDLLASIPRIQPGTWLLRRATFERCGGFREEFRGCGGEDLYMLLLAREQGEFLYLNEPLLLYREPSWSALGQKYWSGFALQLEMLRDRYGTRSKRLRRDISRSYASSFLQCALIQLDAGDWIAAVRNLLVCIRCWPPFIFETGSIRRAFQAHNVRRLLGRVRSAS